MRGLKEFVVMAWFSLSLASLAQSTVTTSGGTADHIAKFSNNGSSIVDSSITETNANVGIRVTNPQAPLDVNGYLHVTGDANPSLGVQGAYLGWNALNGITGEIDLINNQGLGAGGFAFINVPSTGTPATPLMFLSGTGNLGIGNILPQAKLDVNGNMKINGSGFFGSSVEIHSPGLGQNAGDSQTLLSLLSFNLNSSQLIVGQIRNTNGTNWDTATTRIRQRTDVTDQGYIDFNPAGGSYGMAFGSGNSEYMRLIAGNVGIGTGIPTARLEVNGTLKLTAGSGASMIFPDSTVQSTAWNGTTCGGDYAESVDVAGDRRSYEPGDLLVIDPEHEGGFLKSSEAYATGVTGVFSTKPGLTGRRQLTSKSDEEVPMAMVGIVPTKVSAENGAIKPGDLLVSSSKPGYAMKGTDRSKMLGAVIGKALGHLDKGAGVIEVVILMQ